MDSSFSSSRLKRWLSCWTRLPSDSSRGRSFAVGSWPRLRCTTSWAKRSSASARSGISAVSMTCGPDLAGVAAAAPRSAAMDGGPSDRPAAGRSRPACRLDAWRLRIAGDPAQGSDCRTRSAGGRTAAAPGAAAANLAECRAACRPAAGTPGLPRTSDARTVHRPARLVPRRARPGRLLAGRAADGDGEFDHPAAQRVRDPARGVPRARPRQDVAHRHRGGGHDRLVGRRHASCTGRRACSAGLC